MVYINFVLQSELPQQPMAEEHNYKKMELFLLEVVPVGNGLQETMHKDTTPL
jgi:hypothetical protein